MTSGQSAGVGVPHDLLQDTEELSLIRSAEWGPPQVGLPDEVQLANLSVAREQWPLSEQLS